MPRVLADTLVEICTISTNFEGFGKITKFFLTRSQFGGWGWGGIVGNGVSNIKRSRGWETTIRDGRAEQGSVRFDAERRKMMIKMKLEIYSDFQVIF